MTNEELIAKINAEIERLKGYYRITNPYDKRAIRVCENLISFLSTLEPEKPVPADLEEAAEEYLQRVKAGFLRTLEHPTAKDCFIHGAKWDREQMLKDAVKWLVDDDYNPQTDKGGFILGSVGIGYNGYYIPYSDLLKLPKEDGK